MLGLSSLMVGKDY